MNFKTFFNQIILEKDNRPKILKMGISQEVADYLHGIHDKYSLWFADKFNKMPGFVNARNQVQFVRNSQTQITGILDWIRNTPNIQINNFSWEQASEAEKQYHDSLQVSSDLNLETNKIIQKYDDGFYWVDLESCSDRSEASAMGHCATTSKGDTLYSLRAYNKATKNIEPFITISVSPGKGEWHQCKGKKNSKPKKQYWRYIADILIKNNIFKYVSEYDSGNDFGPHEFIEYVEENSNSIPDADEIVEKIKEGSVSYGDFVKILKEFSPDFKYYEMRLDNDGDSDNSVYVLYSFGITISEEETNLPIHCLDLENKDAQKYFYDVIDAHLSDSTVKNTDESIAIYGNIEDDSSYSLDEEGLASFKGQCQYYSERNKDFDKEAFLEDHLPKILVLDGCMEHDLGDFIDKVEVDLSKIFKVRKHPKTLDVEITSGGIRSYIPKPSYSSDSILRRSGSNTLVFKSPKQLIDEAGFKYQRHADLLLYTVFWHFIKNNVLQIATDTFRTILDTDGKEFKFKFFYEWENEKYNFEKEYDTLSLIENKFDNIASYFHKFETEVVTPFIMNKKPLDINAFIVKKDELTDGGRKTILSVYDPEELYIGRIEADSDEDRESINIEIAELAKRRDITGKYHKLNIDKVDKWLSDNIPHQMSFKGFFENYLNSKQ
jgi:hypothetical protein